MKKLTALILIVAILFALIACNTNDDPADNTLSEFETSETEPPKPETPEPEETTVSNDKQNEERPYDKYGILYEEEIKYYLSEYGSIYWDPTQEFYVLTPRDTFRQVILGLVKDPFDKTYLEYWDLITEIIKLVSDEYPSAICVRNPANSSSYLLIIVMGDVGYSAF